MDLIHEDRAVISEMAKPILNDRVLGGYWLPFNELSGLLVGMRDGKLIGFREVFEPSSLNETDLGDVRCCLNHNENQFLGRTPTTLTIGRDDRGMTFECKLPNLPVGNEAVEYVNRGDYQGNSFRFYTSRNGQDDSWERQQDGTYIRTIKRNRRVRHLGPVFDPAYVQTDLSVALRSLVTETDDIEIVKEAVQKQLQKQRERDLYLRSKMTSVQFKLK